MSGEGYLGLEIGGEGLDTVHGIESCHEVGSADEVDGEIGLGSGQTGSGYTR